MAVLTSAWASYTYAYACVCVGGEGLDLYTILVLSESTDWFTITSLPWPVWFPRGGGGGGGGSFL